MRNGKPAGHLTSAAYGHTVGAAVAMGYVVSDGSAVDDAFVEGGRYQINVAGTLVGAKAHLRPPYDPKSERVKG